MGKYILAVDQSTQGTKALLFDENATLIARADTPHKQIINELGWVEHNPEEIYQNTLLSIRKVVEDAKIHKDNICALGISNQRETSLVWEKSGKPLYPAIVWQDSRATDICGRVEKAGLAGTVLEKTGIRLSPYFPAAKIGWILEHVEAAKKAITENNLYIGTIDAYLVYRLTNGVSYKTDYSNASRTQLFNIRTLSWDQELCNAFHIPMHLLPEVTDSDAYFGETNLDGFLNRKIPIYGVLGDSHGALFGQGCVNPGMLKATYGTGSSVMMNLGEKAAFSHNGLVTSLAWKINGKVNYVLEGNINYTGATITWLKDDVKLIESPGQTQALAKKAIQNDRLYLVPAFTGLGAPYWDSDAMGIIYGITRTTGKNELVRAALESIAYQIGDVVKAMEEDAGIDITEIRADGGPTKNEYLMQFQSDITGKTVNIAPIEELSGMGAAYVAGLSAGLYNTSILWNFSGRKLYVPLLEREIADEKYAGWKVAVEKVLTKKKGTGEI